MSDWEIAVYVVLILGCCVMAYCFASAWLIATREAEKT